MQQSMIIFILSYPKEKEKDDIQIYCTQSHFKSFGNSELNKS